MPLPIIYTNRAAFDAAVGSYSLLTLDAPAQPVITPPNATATYGNLITFTFDYPAGYGVNPGFVVIGVAGLNSFGEVLVPVTAFGFDILSAEVAGAPGVPGLFGSSGFTFSAAGLHFLGLVSDTPFTADVRFVSSTFTIDNVAIKTATTAAGILPPTGLTVK